MGPAGLLHLDILEAGFLPLTPCLLSLTGNCPMIHIPGFTFPVVEYLLEDIIEKIR